MDHQHFRMQVQQVQAVGYHTAICKDASLKKDHENQFANA